MSDIY